MGAPALFRTLFVGFGTRCRGEHPQLYPYGDVAVAHISRVAGGGQGLVLVEKLRGTGRAHGVENGTRSRAPAPPHRTQSHPKSLGVSIRHKGERSQCCSLVPLPAPSPPPDPKKQNLRLPALQNPGEGSGCPQGMAGCPPPLPACTPESSCSSLRTVWVSLTRMVAMPSSRAGFKFSPMSSRRIT